MRRIDAMRAALDVIGEDLVICNQGGNGEDLWELRPRNIFLMPHAMGLTTAVALGVALELPQERIWAFEGDGGMLMNLGLLGVIAKCRPANLRVAVFDNEDYSSGGPYPTLTKDTVDLAAVALASGWGSAETVSEVESFRAGMAHIADAQGLNMLVAKVLSGTDGAGVSIDGVEGKLLFVRDLERKTGREVIHTPGHYSSIA